MNVCYNGAPTRQNYGTATEKLAFEYDKSFSRAMANLHQQNSIMTSGIKLQRFLIEPFTIYRIRNSLLYVSIRNVLLDFL